MEPKPSTSEDKTTISPKNKRPKLTSFTVNEKFMILNTYKYVKQTWPIDKYPYSKEVAQTTANILGIGVASVYRILKDYKENGKISSPVMTKTRPTFADKIDGFTKSVIRKKVYAFFLKGELPTLKKVLNDINGDDMLPNFKRSTFQRILKHLKFKSIKKQRHNALIDKDDIVMWRRKYLHKIKECREKNLCIFYMHEAWVNPGHTVNKTKVETNVMSEQKAFSEGLSTDNLKSKGRRLIVVHIGNQEGFVKDGSWVFESKSNGNYYDSIDAASFERWFEEILPKLGQNSIVVMDNASYHSRRQVKTPDSTWSKANIRKWLRDKNISFDENEIKLELLKKINEAKDQYKIYEIAKKYGIKILRLPPYHCDLNPIEIIWANVKDHITINSTTLKLEKLQVLLNETMGSVTPSQWQECIGHALKEEEKFGKLDSIVDEVLDKFIIRVADTDSESTDTAESASDCSDFSNYSDN